VDLPWRRADAARSREVVTPGWNQPLAWFALLGLIALVGMASVLATTRHGTGLTPDSAAYIGTADNLVAGDGFTVPFHEYPLDDRALGPTPDKPAVALTHFVPLYPAALAAGSYVTGGSTRTVARWLGALVFAGTIALVGVTVLTLTGGSALTSLVAAGLTAGAADLFRVHAAALSEPLFLPLAFAALLLLARYRERATLARLCSFAVMAGLATLARLSGGAVILTGLIVIAAASGSWRRRLAHGALATAMAVAPLVVWLATRASAGGARPLAFHPVTIGDIKGGVLAMAGWVLPSVVPRAVDTAAVLAGGVAVGLLYRSARRRCSPAIDVLLLFVPAYLAFMLISITFFDANASPLAPRILTPIHLALLVALPCLVRVAWPPNRSFASASLGALGAASAVVLVTLLTSARGVAWIGTNHSNGLGYASQMWRQSPAIAAAKALPAGSLVYTNAPDALYLLAHRAASTVPQRQNSVSLRINRSFDDDLRAVAGELRVHHGSVVYLYLPFRQFVPAPVTLRRVMGLRTVLSVRDGLVLAPRG
jgi:hypothetical protein